MKKLIALSLVSFSVLAEPDARIYPLQPDGSRDYRGPNFAVEGNKIYQTQPDGTRDYRKPAYVISGDKAYKTLPDGSRDYRAPPMKLMAPTRSGSI